MAYMTLPTHFKGKKRDELEMPSQEVPKSEKKGMESLLGLTSNATHVKIIMDGRRKLWFFGHISECSSLSRRVISTDISN